MTTLDAQLDAAQALDTVRGSRLTMLLDMFLELVSLPEPHGSRTSRTVLVALRSDVGRWALVTPRNAATTMDGNIKGASNSVLHGLGVDETRYDREGGWTFCLGAIERRGVISTMLDSLVVGGTI